MANTGAIRAGRAFVELFADNRKLVTGLRAAEYHVQAFGTKVKSIGMSMVASGTAMLSPLVASMKVFGGFEKNMNMVSTMLDKPEQFMGQFSEGIRSLAKDFGESTSTLSKGLYDILSAAFAPEDAMSFLSVAARAAIGGISDTATAVDGLTSILNAFQMSAKAAANVADVMFNTVLRGKITFTELAEQIGRVAPMARAAGTSFEVMMGALATMTRPGLSMDEAVTRLANILKQAPMQAKDLVGLISRYVGADLGTIIIDFPEIRAATGISALAGNIEGLVHDINLMYNSTGAAAEAFKKMTVGTLYELGRLWAVVKDIAISTGEALAPAIKRVADWMRIAGDATSKWISENKGLVQTYAAVAVGVTALGIALVALGIIVGSVATIIGAMASVFGFLLSPIGLAIFAIVGFGYAILEYTNSSGTALNWLAGVFNTLKGDALTAFQGISDALEAGSISQAAKILWATLKLEWVRGTTFIMNLWARFVGYLTKAAIQIGAAIVAAPLVAIYKLENALFAAASTFLKAWLGAVDFVGKKIIWLRDLMDFSNTFDADAAYAAIEQGAEDRNKAIDESKKALEEKHAKGLDVFGKNSREMRGDVDALTDAYIAANENAVLQAQQELASAVAEARDMKSAIKKPEEQAATEAPGMPAMPAMPQIELPEIGELIAQEAAKIGTRGTFSGFAAFGMGVGSGVEERTAKASEATAKNTQAILKELKDNQLEFA